MNKQELIQYACDELIGKGNLDIIAVVFTEDYIAHAEDKEYKGHEFIRRYARQIRSAMPDIHVSNVQFLVHEDHTIAWQRTLRGVHKTNMMGIPPSGKAVEWNEMVVSRFEDHKIAEEWVVSDLAGQLLLKLPLIIK